MRGLSQIISAFLLLTLTVIGAGLVYMFVVDPFISSLNKPSRIVLAYVTDYNSTHSICYVVEGSLEGLVYNGTTWVYGVAKPGDLVIVPRVVAEVKSRS